MQSGRIHSIDTFSTVDGPGIRTVVFMQGCHLRCRYCQNPDTWDCYSATAHEYSSSQILSIILKNLPYIESSGGGVTFSGGEPLLQHEFVKEVFAECRSRNIHTALDTSLHVSSARVSEIIPVTSLFLADIKHMREDKSLSLTGSGNKSNLSNLQLINRHGVEIWIRYVVVPGWTDDEENIVRIGEFVSGLDCVTRIELLPYHSLGSHKWSLLGLKYDLADTPAPEAGTLKTIQNQLEKTSGKKVTVPTAE